MTTVQIKSRRFSRGQWRAQITGLLLVSPWIIGFLAFTAYPLLSSMYYSFTRYDLVRAPVFIGLQNYIEIFTQDPRFWEVTYNTLYYAGFGVPLGVMVAFLVAFVLNMPIKGRSFFRAAAYIPSIVPAICSAMVWMFLLNIQYGAINGMLQAFQLPTIPFLSSVNLVKPSLVTIRIWGQGAAVVIFLAALQDVPRSLYEAAIVDGANPWQRFWHVTFPMCTPVILFNLVIGFIGGFQEFLMPFLLTNGGPVNSSRLYGMYLYENAFQQLRMGKASALAWLLFVAIIAFTAVLFKSSTRWVYYGGEK